MRKPTTLERYRMNERLLKHIILVLSSPMYLQYFRAMKKVLMQRQYSQKHDSYYCEVKDVWLEEGCDDNTCEFCVDRPERPSMVGIIEFKRVENDQIYQI